MVLSKLTALLFTEKPESPHGVEELKDALTEDRTRLKLEGVFEEPYLDKMGVNTAVLPISVYEIGGDSRDYYTQIRREFEIEEESHKNLLERRLDSFNVGGLEDLDQLEGTVADVGIGVDGGLFAMPLAFCRVPYQLIRSDK